MYKCWQCLWLTDRKFCWVIFFFFQYDNLFSEAQCICMSHFFLYRLDWFANHDISCSCKIWRYHQLMWNFIINSCTHIFFSLWCLTFILSVPFLYQRISGWFCKHLAVIYFTRILICIKLTQPELLCLLLSFVIFIWKGNQQPRLQKKKTQNITWHFNIQLFCIW